MLLHLLLRRLTQNLPATTRRAHRPAASTECRPIGKPVLRVESPRVGFDYRRNTRPLRWRTRDAFAPPSASIDANLSSHDTSDFTDLSPRQTCRPVGKPGPRVEPHVWALTTDATRGPLSWRTRDASWTSF